MASDLTDLNPEFVSRLNNLRAALDKAGIGYSVISGYRTPEQQNQMYQNHLAKQAGRALPYPNVEAPKVVAPAWGSFHNYGLAADFTANDPADYARIRQMATQFGLTGIGASDPGHIQMEGGSLGDVLAANKIPQGWRPGTDNAVASSQPFAPYKVAGAMQPPPKGVLAAPGAGLNPFVSSLHQIESSGINQYSKVDKDYPGQPNSRSQGYDQIDVPTWRQFGAKAGIDLTKYPTPMSAPMDVQDSVASLIPLSRFGPATQAKLQKQFGQFDSSKTVGELSQQFGGGTAPTAAGVVDPTAQHGGPGAAPGTAGSTVNPPIGGPLAAPANADTPWWQKPFQSPGTTTDAQGNTVNQQSPAAKAVADYQKSQQVLKQKEADEAPSEATVRALAQSPGARNVGPQGGINLSSVPQTYGQTLNSIQQPLTWNNLPPQPPTGPRAGFQMAQTPANTFGMSLDTFQMPQLQTSAVGYGFDPTTIGYGFG